MTSVPTQLPAVPPYQVAPLVAQVNEPGGPFSLTAAGVPTEVSCAQAVGSEIYLGCSNGELLRYAIEVDGPSRTQSYTLLSRQSLPQDKPANDIIIAPSIARALVLSGHYVHFYTLPTLDPVPQSLILPLRNVIALAVDEHHLARPPLGAGEPPAGGVEPIDFCIVKRGSVNLYQLRERLFFQKDLPLPQGASVTLARRAGKYMCFADRENYNVIDLEQASLIPLLPISQAPDSGVVIKPSITIVGVDEFLIISWTGVSALGVFITGRGDPVRGTLEWPAYPETVSLDYPYITALLPNQTIEVHNVEDQQLAQVVPAPLEAPAPPFPGWPPAIERRLLAACLGRYMVPSMQTAAKMRMKRVKLLRP